MTKHLIRSRVTKAFTDAGLAASFAEAEARLDAVRSLRGAGRRSSENASRPSGGAHGAGRGLQMLRSCEFSDERGSSLTDLASADRANYRGCDKDFGRRRWPKYSDGCDPPGADRSRARVGGLAS